MQRESVLLGLCQNTWDALAHTWSLSCEAGAFVITFALFLAGAIAIVVGMIGLVIAEINKAKRSGIDVDAIIRDARRAAYERGRQHHES